VLHQTGHGGLIVSPRVVMAQETGMLRGEYLGREAARHCCILESLHFNGVWRSISLELSHDKSTRPVESEHVEPISFNSGR
jgi:hypothetical protein